MTKPRHSVFERLRRRRWLPAWLLVLALCNVLAGLHAASHIGAVLAAPAATADGDGTAPDHGECPACRVAGNWAFALAPAVLLLLSARRSGAMPHPPVVARCAPDAAARWRQRLKHGPPRFSR